MLRRFADDPDEGVGVIYTRLPPMIARSTYDVLDPDGQRYYVPGEQYNHLTLTYVLPPGSYDAFMVKMKGER